jgi:2-methylaconitate cis-trans-isomerase PrpF
VDYDFKPFACSIVRGGTSKGLFFKANELPEPGNLRDRIVLRLMGSPDLSQIDGLGGANSLTSKIAIVGPSRRPDADVDYTFGQVSVDKPKIDWQGNCGNLTSAVGVFAVHHNLVHITEPDTIVRIFNTNTEKIIHVHVPVKGGKPRSHGKLSIPGVPGTGAGLEVEFFDPAGGVTRKLLPTGNVIDLIDLGDKGKFTVSIVDAVTPVVYMRAEELGLKGTELPTEVEAMPRVLNLMEIVRSKAAELSGIVDKAEEATEKSPAFPKIGFVSKSQDYINPEGKFVSAESIDITARLGSMQKMHRAYMIGGAVSSGAAALIPGTVVWEALSERARKNGKTLIIGHPYGPMEIRMESLHIGEESSQSIPVIKKVSVFRTARVLMDGIAYLPDDVANIPGTGSKE